MRRSWLAVGIIGLFVCNALQPGVASAAQIVGVSESGVAGVWDCPDVPAEIIEGGAAPSSRGCTFTPNGNTVTAQPTGGIVPGCPVNEPNCSDPYSPDNYGTCELVALANNVIRFFIGLISVVGTIILVYAGYLLVISQGNVSQMKRAKAMFTSVLIGMVILFSSFLVVNTILGILVGNNSPLMNWNSIECSYANKTGTPLANVIDLNSYTNSLVLDTGYVIYDTTSVDYTASTPFVSGDCSPANLARYGMNAEQAQVFSCIAKYESNCNLNADNPVSTARGVFQILRGYNNTCHNLNLPACTQAARAAGYAVSGNLNCSQAFSGGQRKPNPNPLADACDAAASNLSCNVAATLCLYNDGGGYNPWLGNPGQNHHQQQRACVARYAQ